MTSNGFREALEAAITNAGLDVEKFSQTTTEEPAEKEEVTIIMRIHPPIR